MSARLTRKRARLEAEAEAQEQPRGEKTSAAGATFNDSEAQDWVQDSEFWFEDGTITLRAQDVAFRVYRGPLVEHSAVFRDMLSFPQPQQEQSIQADQTPLVTLTDSPHDLRHVLRVLMPKKRLRLSGAQSISLATAIACVRLGHKYQIDHLLEESLKFLRYYYTDNFDLLRKNHEKSPPLVHAISVVNVARLTGASYLLPMAIAECCRLGSAIINGLQLEDGTREYLSQADLGLCFQAKDKLVEARIQAVSHILNTDYLVNCKHTSDDSDSDSSSGTEDHEDIAHILQEMLKGKIPGLCTPHVWESVVPILNKHAPDLCHRCLRDIKREEARQQKLIFARLPALVGVTVDGWCARAQA